MACPEEAREALQVMVVGAGSSGLLVAQALKKAGISCTVFEQDVSLDARPRDWDFGIYWAQSPLGQCLPDELNDLLMACQVDNHTPSASDFMLIKSGLDGSTLKEVPAPFNLRLQRRKFIRLISTGIDIRYGKRVAKIETTEDGVTAIFEDGSQHIANLVVGAEGAHSVVRQFLLGPEKAALIPSPLVASVTIARLPAEAALKQREVHPRYCIWFHPKGYFSWTGVHDCYDKPNPEDWEFMLMQSWMQEEPIHLKGPDILKDMKARAKEFPEPYNSIFQAIPEGTKAWHNRLTYWPTQPWNNRNGRVTLAGDAAHPMTFHRGQGLNNAINDAATLFKEVQAMPAKTPEALAAAVSAYEEEMQVRGKEAVESSNENSLAIHDWAKLLKSPLFRSGLLQKVAKEVDPVPNSQTAGQPESGSVTVDGSGSNGHV